MEPLQESPDVTSKLLAMLSVVKEPVPKDLLLKWLTKDWGVDATDPQSHAEIDTVLQSEEVQRTESSNGTLYRLAPERLETTARIAHLQDEAKKAIIASGLRRYGRKS
jgi:hypothetical protein